MHPPIAQDLPLNSGQVNAPGKKKILVRNFVFRSQKQQALDSKTEHRLVSAYSVRPICSGNRSRIRSATRYTLFRVCFPSPLNVSFQLPVVTAIFPLHCMQLHIFQAHKRNERKVKKNGTADGHNICADLFPATSTYYKDMIKNHHTSSHAQKQRMAQLRKNKQRLLTSTVDVMLPMRSCAGRQEEQ